MPRVIVPIDLGNNKKGAVAVSEDVAKYFNIAAPATPTGSAMIETPAKPFTRKVYSGITDVTGRTVDVRPGARRVRPPKAASASGGKAIRVPTDVVITDTKTVGGTSRTTKYNKMVTIRFPSGATMAAISKWLFEECKVKKPTFFIAPSGARYTIVDDLGVADINPGPPPVTGATA